MTKEVKLRRGTTAQHAAFTGAVGEVTVDTDKNTLVVHDGVTPGGHPAPRVTTKFDAVLYAANWGANCLNLFDEVWELGAISTSTGANISSTTVIRSVNYISVSALSSYRLSADKGITIRVFFYDSGNTFLSSSVYVMPASGITITTPESSAKIRIHVSVTEITYFRWFMINAGTVTKPWEPQGRGYHLKASDYTGLSGISAVTNIAIEEPDMVDTTSVKLRALRSAKLTAGFQTAATEIVLIASGVVPGIDVPIRVFLKGDM